jgi:hypothetical protein
MEHRTKTLAQNEQCSVLQCSCGALHISVGAVTVRVRQAAAEQLRDVLAAALQKIAAEPRALGVPPRGDDLPS